ncbi:hypothetical protein GF376_00880 [Candidatus Peregrinibacteria bacterium]|nr:hypothetical protein [Candidatus Peregrinibacteria bacterium]
MDRFVKKSLLSLIVSALLIRGVSAEIIFQDDLYHEVLSEGVLIDSLNQTGSPFLKFGNDGSDGEISWNNLNNEFEIDHKVIVTGGIESDGVIDFSAGSSFRIREESFGGNFNGISAPVCGSEGELAVDSDTDDLYICKDALSNNWSQIAGGGGSAIDLDMAYDNFGANASIITIDALQGQTGGLVFDGQLSGDEAVTIRNSDDGGAVTIENDGIGDSLRVNDGFGDSTPFVIDDIGNVGVLNVNPQNPLDLETFGDVIEIGDNSANDICIVFDDDAGVDRKLCWNDAEGGFEFSEPLAGLGIKSSPTPPGPCSASLSGEFWFNSATGLVYVCDTSNGRNKWLSSTANVFWGEALNASCGGNVSSLINSPQCPVRYGANLGYRNQRNGLYVPDDITIVGVGFNIDQNFYQNGCNVDFSAIYSPQPYNFNSNGSEITLTNWVVSGTGDLEFAIQNLNVDVPGGNWINFGPEPKNCQVMNNYIMNIYYRFKGA